MSVFISTFRVKAEKRLTARLHKLDKSFHDCMHALDSGYKSEFISELNVDGFDDEQIFQQKELQNDAAVRQVLENFSVTNIEEAPLCFTSSNDWIGGKGKKDKTGQKVEVDKVRMDKSDGDSDDSVSDVGSEVDSDESDAELARIKERIKGRESDEFGLFNEDIPDSEDETLFKGTEEDEQDEDENDFDFEIDTPPKDSAKQKQQMKKAPVKRKTEVDDKFFKLADMEEFLEREDRREERKQRQTGSVENNKDEHSSEESEEDTEDIDMFAEWSDEDTAKVKLIHINTAVVVVAAFSLHARMWGEGLAIHSPPALFSVSPFVILSVCAILSRHHLLNHSTVFN